MFSKRTFIGLSLLMVTASFATEDTNIEPAAKGASAPFFVSEDSLEQDETCRDLFIGSDGLEIVPLTILKTNGHRRTPRMLLDCVKGMIMAIRQLVVRFEREVLSEKTYPRVLPVAFTKMGGCLKAFLRDIDRYYADTDFQALMPHMATFLVQVRQINEQATWTGMPLEQEEFKGFQQIYREALLYGLSEQQVLDEVHAVFYMRGDVDRLSLDEEAVNWVLDLGEQYPSLKDSEPFLGFYEQAQNWQEIKLQKEIDNLCSVEEKPKIPEKKRRPGHKGYSKHQKNNFNHVDPRIQIPPLCTKGGKERSRSWKGHR